MYNSHWTRYSHFNVVIFNICALLFSYSDVDIEAQFSINQSRADEITMREDYGNLPMTIHDDGFGDIGFDADGPDFIRDDVDAAIDVSFYD